MSSAMCRQDTTRRAERQHLPATIRIAGAADTVDGIESVNAGFINLARVQLGKAETLKIQLSEGLVNVDDVQEATVTF